jgi:hypothetical protein
MATEAFGDLKRLRTCGDRGHDAMTALPSAAPVDPEFPGDRLGHGWLDPLVCAAERAALS